MRTFAVTFLAGLSVVTLISGTALGQGDNVISRADYRNTIFTDVPTNALATSLGQTASIAIFSGNIGGGTNDLTTSTNIVRPHDGTNATGIYLLQSVIGQPFGGLPLPYYLPGLVWLSATNPVVFTAPATNALSVQAWQLAFDEFVSRVDFLAAGGPGGSNLLLGSFTNSLPLTNTYQLTWTNDLPGNYSVTAVATDNRGLATTSAPVSISVIPGILVNGQYTNTHSFTFVATNTIQIAMTNPLAADGFIRYTLDGSDPTDGAFYDNPFFISDSALIRAVLTDPFFTPLAEVDSVNITVIPMYNLSASTPGGGAVAVSPPVGPYVSNAVVSLTATPSNNWTFMGWTGDVVTNATNISVSMIRSKSVQAIFGTTISNVPPSGGTIQAAPNLALYPFGSTVRLTAVPASTNYFLSWGGAATFAASNNPLNFSINVASPVFSAAFARIPSNKFALNLQIGNGSGTVVPAPYGTVYNSGASVTVTATPASGQVFTGWSGDTNGTQNPLPLTMNTNKTIIANFSTNSPPTIAITNPPDGSIFVAPTPIPLGVATASAVGSVTNVTYLANQVPIATLTNAPFSFAWSNTVPDTYSLTAVALASSGLANTSSPVTVIINLPPPGPAVFTLSTNAYTVSETNGGVTITVLKSFNSYAGVVNYSTADGTGVAVANGVGNYTNVSSSLSFASNEYSKTFSIGIRDNRSYYTGNRTFNLKLDTSGDGSTLGNPSLATVTILDVDSPPSSNSVTVHLNTGCLPGQSGQMSVDIVPAGSSGQWRLAREFFWRGSGDTINNLPSGSYEVEFKPIAGFAQPDNLSVVVPDGVATPLQTNFPYARLFPPPATGSLTITLNPSQGQWRLSGESNWLASGVTLTNLIAANYVIEFNTLAGYATPPPQTAVVPAGSTNYIVTYQAPNNLNWFQPSPVVFINGDCPPFTGDYTHNYNGQLLTDSGFGSGCVVKPRVVLTAAHVIFDDLSLSFVPTVRWFFQRQAGQYEPPQQTARGSYVLSGYAAARTNDVATNGPGVSSPASQNLDVSALFFFEDAGRGGQSGYLVATNADGSQWLQSGLSMTMAGYPVENVSDTNRGRLFSTLEAAYTFNYVTNDVFGTTNVAGYPGMSGAPLFVQYQGWYYPAGVYLGGSQQSIVRAIDGAVADLINRADVNANTGDNNTGGGVIRLIPVAHGTAKLAYVQLTLAPPAAVAAGAGWRLLGDTNAFQNDPNYTYAISGTNPVSFEFKTLSGWNLPASRNIPLVLGTVTNLVATYAISNTVMSLDPQHGLGLSGPSGVQYRIDYRTNLLLGSWLPLKTNTLGPGFNPVLPWPPTNGPAAFYRAVLLP